MKSKFAIVLLLVSGVISAQLGAKESDGLKFWKGTGGQVVGAGLIYWLVSVGLDDEEDGQSNFYAKENSLQHQNSIYFNDEPAGHALFFSTPLVESELVSSYAFVGTNSEFAHISDNRLEYTNESLLGVGFNFELQNNAELTFEYANYVSVPGVDTSLISLTYRHRFN
jgi:hypothetical protein